MRVGAIQMVSHTLRRAADMEAFQTAEAALQWQIGNRWGIRRRKRNRLPARVFLEVVGIDDRSCCQQFFVGPKAGRISMVGPHIRLEPRGRDGILAWLAD